MTTIGARHIPWSSPETQPPIRILVVDDYAEVRAVVAKILNNAGYVVTCANSGEEALHAITSSHDGFDMLLTDWQMPPGMWGDELVRRARAYIPALCIVVMTGEPEAFTNSTGLVGLNSLVLRKPFRPPDLLGAVRAVRPQDGRYADDHSCTIL